MPSLQGLRWRNQFIIPMIFKTGVGDSMQSDAFNSFKCLWNFKSFRNFSLLCYLESSLHFVHCRSQQVFEYIYLHELLNDTNSRCPPGMCQDRVHYCMRSDTRWKTADDISLWFMKTYVTAALQINSMALLFYTISLLPGHIWSHRDPSDETKSNISCFYFWFWSPPSPEGNIRHFSCWVFTC